MCLKNLEIIAYGLCPSHYLSAPGVSWDVMPKMTKVKLELTPDPEMYILENVTIGEISYISLQ